MSHGVRETRQIAIIGVHRSGTSLVAEILRELGVNLGRRLDDNLEDRSVKWLNEWILRRAGGSWDNPAPFEFLLRNEALLDAVVRRHVRTRERRVRRRLDRDGAWAIKDPRLCITLPLWRSILEDSLVVEVQRDGRDVAKSLFRRAARRRELDRDAFTVRGIGVRLWRAAWPLEGYGNESVRCLDVNEAFRLWEEYLEWLTRNLRHVPADRRIRLRYEHLLREPGKVIDELSDFLGGSIGRQPRDRAVALVGKPSQKAGVPDIDAGLVKGSAWLRDLGYLE